MTFRVTYAMPGYGRPTVIYEGDNLRAATAALIEEIERTGETDSGSTSEAAEKVRRVRQWARGIARTGYLRGRAETFTVGPIVHTIEDYAGDGADNEMNAIASQMLAALVLAEERLEINDCEGEERKPLATIRRAIKAAKRAGIKPPAD